MKVRHSPLLQQYIIAIIVNFGSLTAGISLSWPSPMIMKLYNGTDSAFSRPITDEEGSWIVSAGHLAATGTTLMGGFLIDGIGRKYSIILVTLLRIIASIWTILVTEVWMLIICRAVMVVTDCFILMVVPVYVSEISSKDHHGPLGTLVHITACLGMVITLAIGPFVSYSTLNIFMATAIIVASLPLPFIPDSPVYLYSKGHIDDAIKVLSKIRNSDEIIKQELKEYKSSKQNKIEKIVMLKNKTFLKSLLMGILICGGSNVIGYIVVLYYLQTILDSCHTNVKPEFASVIIACIQLFAAVCSTFFTRIFGRRPMMIYSIVGVFFGLIGLGTFFQISTSESHIVNDFLNYLPVISLIICSYCFNAGIGCLLFLVTAELFDAPHRAFGFSICLVTNLFLAFLTLRYFTQMTIILGSSGTFWFFSVMCIIIGTLIALFVPETKGKTLSEIRISLGNKIKNLNEENVVP